MELIQALIIFAFCLPSFSQLTTSSPPAVTVTSISTLAIVILPSSSSTTYYTPTTLSTTSTPATTSETTTSLVLQTVPYTGQSMLVGTCQIAQFTGLSLQNGAVIEVPLVGCSDDRPECCPSLSPPEVTETITKTSIVASGATVLSATGVISMLSASPLSICPSDFIDLDPVCCPSGYKLYGQSIVGNQPCYSMLATNMPLPAAASTSIVSAIAETASSATASVSVVLNQVFALGLPCQGEPSSSSGLSTGAKAGIGVGAGVAALVILSLVIALCYKKRKVEPLPPDKPVYYTPGSQPPQMLEKHMSTSTGPAPSPMGTYQSQSSPPSFGFPGQTLPHTYPVSPGFDPNQVYPGWQDRRQVSQPPQYNAPPVEMLAPTSPHEIGDGLRQRDSFQPPGEGSSDIRTSEASAYEAQRGRVE